MSDILASSAIVEPNAKQKFLVVKNKKVSPDSNILTIKFEGRDYLGWNPYNPTCISAIYKDDTETLKKSYSPISHPMQKDTFDLLVKAYPKRPGGGVGAYLCSLEAGDVFEGSVKSERIMHKSPEILNRWDHVGLIGGGTGIAPLFQILTILLEDEKCKTKISVLSINRVEDDILMREELDALEKKYPDRVKVTYSLTGEEPSSDSGIKFNKGRGDVGLARRALPDPSEGDLMVFVCGKKGFVEFWAGGIAREKTTDGSKGKKIQGELKGLLRDANFKAEQVFKY